MNTRAIYSLIVLLSASLLGSCGPRSSHPAADDAEPSFSEGDEVPASEGEETPSGLGVAEQFARFVWAPPEGETFYQLSAMIYQGELLLMVAQDHLSHMYVHYEEVPVTVEGRTLSFDIPAYRDTPERVVLELHPDGRHVDVLRFFELRDGAPPPRTLEPVDTIEQSRWVLLNDLAHDDGGVSPEKFAFTVLSHAAVRRGVREAGLDPLTLNSRDALDLISAGQHAVTAELRASCDALREESCAASMQAIVDAVVARLRP